jgi:hypothetical protein
MMNMPLSKARQYLMTDVRTMLSNTLAEIELGQSQSAHAIEVLEQAHRELVGMISEEQDNKKLRALTCVLDLVGHSLKLLRGER